MDLVLVFGVPWSTRSDSGTGFTVKGVEHLFRRQNEPIHYGSANHARAQMTVESPRGGVDSRSSGRAMQILAQTLGPVRVRSTLAATHHAFPLPSVPFRLPFFRDVRSQMDSETPGLDGSDFLQYRDLHNSVADQSEAWIETPSSTARFPETAMFLWQHEYTTCFGRNPCEER